jgi:hypothetical protein
MDTDYPRISWRITDDFEMIWIVTTHKPESRKQLPSLKLGSSYPGALQDSVAIIANGSDGRRGLARRLSNGCRDIRAIKLTLGRAGTEPYPDGPLGEVVERILMPAINDPRHARPKADPVETPS